MPGLRCSTHDSTEKVERCLFWTFSVERCPISTFWVERCPFSTLFDFTGHCSILFDFTGHCSTLFDFIGNQQKSPYLQRNSDIIWLFLSNHLSKTSAWAATKCTRKRHKIDSCSPDWVVGLTFQSNRPKMAVFWPFRLKMALFWPTRTNLAMFWPTWLKKNGFDCVCCKLTMLRPTRPKLAMFRPTRPKDKLFDRVWSKPVSFERTQPKENLIDRSPLYFERLEEISGVSNFSTKRKCFQLGSTQLTLKKIPEISVNSFNQNWK